MDGTEHDYDFEPECDGLSNHLPMAAAALARLGADSARVAEFRNAYERRLVRLGASTSPPPDVRALLGRRLDFPGLTALFGLEVAQLTRHGAVRKWLPRLMPGVAAAAFHPLIELYYALDTESDRGTAYALAYFAWSHLPVVRPSAPGPLGLSEALSRLAGLGRTHGGKGPIYLRLELEARRPEVQAVLRQLGPEHDDSAAIALVTSTHQHVNDILSLHLMTAWHAHRRIAELVGTDGAALGLHLTRALLVAYVACNTPTLELDSLPAAERSWNDVIESARRDPDEHVIKFVWTCLDMHTRWQVETLALAERATKSRTSGS